ncbi:LysE family translocator [Flocculibacter collagenilyticus]|uniref:LysE family translocator n=1 Tax=Flocculibacter collagenilyticus TaxID=2744479 RepID=UPI0018F587BC|nr:LysE family translocator [Flocculibacter collagenilyticus]
MTEQLILLATATALLLGSPGPAPLALAATGATFGVKQSTPFLIGILGGLAWVIIATGLGLAALLTQWPKMGLVLQIIGVLYIIYVAFKIARAPMISADNNKAALPSLADGFILNLVNPKAYAAFLALFSQYNTAHDAKYSLVVMALVCFVVAIIVDGLWLLFGAMLKHVFSNPTWARAIRLCFAIAVVLAVLVALFSLA